jgi:hypothetical protein
MKNRIGEMWLSLTGGHCFLVINSIDNKLNRTEHRIVWVHSEHDSHLHQEHLIEYGDCQFESSSHWKKLG